MAALGRVASSASYIDGLETSAILSLTRRLDVIRRDESAESDRLYQARFAHKGLIQQVTHDFQKNSRVLRGQIRLIGPGIAVAADQYRAQDRKAFIVEVCEGADFLQRVEEFQFAAFAEFAE